MTMKMTERDKKLLIILITMLILFLFGWLLIRPIAEKGRKLQEDTLRQEQLRDENEGKMMQLAVLLNKVPEKEERLEGLKEVFYPLMSEQEIDRIFTGAAMSHGVEVSRLYISMAQETGQVLPYVLQKQENAGGETQEDTGAANAYADTDAADVEQAGTQEGALSHLRRADVELVLTGSQAALQSLLDTISNEYQAVLIDSVSWKRTTQRGQEEKAGVNPAAEPATLTLSMDLYMYQ